MKKLGILLVRLAVLCLTIILGYAFGWMIGWLLRM
jgi:hypothetical protein